MHMRIKNFPSWSEVRKVRVNGSAWNRANTIVGGMDRPRPCFFLHPLSDFPETWWVPFLCKDSPWTKAACAGKFWAVRNFDLCVLFVWAGRAPKHHILSRKSFFSPWNVVIEQNLLSLWGTAVWLWIQPCKNIPPTPKGSGSRSILRF